MAKLRAKKEEKVYPLDLSSLNPFDPDKKPRNKIMRVGVELEGAWSKIPIGAPIDHDGSVFGGIAPAGFRIGEIRLGPMFPAQLPKAINKCYPQKVDGTCGLHVHMSFDNLYKYSVLMVPEYQETILGYLIEWAKEEGFGSSHPIWERLLSESRFCQKKFWPDEQVKAKRDHDQLRHGHRYTVINYCWESHKTMECRVLPMFDKPDVAIRAVRRVLDITNACLNILGGDREKVKDKLQLPYDGSYEESIVEIL